MDASVEILLIENAEPPTINEPGVINNLPPKDTSFTAVKSLLTIIDSSTVKFDLTNAFP